MVWSRDYCAADVKNTLIFFPNYERQEGREMTLSLTTAELMAGDGAFV